MKINIVTDEKTLRQKSSETTLEDCLTFDIFGQLICALSEHGGLGLSAIQIGIPLRVCVIQAKLHTPIKMFNPQIETQSDPIRVQGEGCLSFPSMYIDTWRYSHSVISWYDETGKFNRGVFTGLEAVIAQHEIDHMNGVLFTDRSLE
jgi:peptide deformylase